MTKCTIAVPQTDQYNIFTGIAANLSLLSDINVVFWIPEQKPIFDLLEEVRPQYIICPSQLLTPIFIQAIQEYKTELIVVGPTSIAIDNIKLVIAPYQLPQKIIENITANTRYRTYVWNQAANTAQYKHCAYNDIYQSDVLYISNTDITQKKYIVDTLSHIIQQQKYKIKICGQQRLFFNEYIGVPTLQEICALLGSAKVVLDFDNDIIYDCAIGKVFCLSNQKQDICPYYEDNVIEQIDHFLTDDKHRKHYIKRAYNFAINKETYLHRLSDMFNLIDNGEIAEQLLAMADKYK